MNKNAKDLLFRVSMLVSMLTMGIVISMGGFSYVRANQAEKTATVSGDEIPQEITVSDLRIDEGFHLHYTINNPSRKSAYYLRKIEKFDELKQVFSSIKTENLELNNYFLDEKAESPCVTDVNIGESFRGSGRYRVSLYIAENEEDKNGKYYYSNEISYTETVDKVKSPTGVKWQMKDKTLHAVWDNPGPELTQDIRSYEVFLYDSKKVLIASVETGIYEWNFNDVIGITGEAPYKFKIRALSSDISKKSHSDWVESDFYFPSSETVNNTLDEIANAEQISKDDINTIMNMNQTDLQINMRDGSETLNKISVIEEKYNENVVVLDNTAFEGKNSLVKVVGAKLNANADATITLNVHSAGKNDQEFLNKYGYTPNNTFAFNMNLDGDGLSSDGSLSIPVHITLPIPDNMDPSKIRVIHYSSKNQMPEIYSGLKLEIDNINNTFSFTINHFSLFAVTEKTENPGPDPVNPPIPNAESNSETIIVDSNGNTIVEPERWLPTTPDEKKRYAFLGKEPVVFANAEGNAYPVKVYNSIQGPKCFVSFEAVLGDYNMVRTYNVYPNNKPGYSMDSKARITLEIPKTLRNDECTFKMICVTENGRPIVLNDLDKNPNTITFETDKFYAFALIYK